MKNVLLVFAFLFVTATQAQTEEDTFKAETIEFIKIAGSAKVFDDAIDQMGAMVSQENKEAYKKEAFETLDALYGELATIYMQEFIKDEIQELVKFYKTPLGKKLASKQATLAQKGMIAGQSWGMKLQGIAQKYN